MKKNTKKFPKIQKTVKNFLTDESGRITKKDALWIGAGVGIISSVDAATYHFNQNMWGGTTSNYVVTYNPGACNVNHASGVVNWHHSNIPNSTLNGNWITWVTWHGSHWSHWSHGSHGSRW